ncbi:MAG TPA: folylpolyglutamate synthase/dihydrofolate synthase family protein [Marinilabiliaceae bacterium]|nr:folylpolyglutamate synthase/dihydrofolate synthase family protein [Marinilabiliaceae bacterium]
MNSYYEATQFLFDQLPMFQRTGVAAYKNNLDNSHRLDHYFGFPHRKFTSVHIAGTNGKGSVSHMLASILQEAGFKTGLYTSPHLRDFRERIKVNGVMISEERVVDFVNDHTDLIMEMKPSFFEMTVAMAFDYFAKEEVDIAIVEVGLGGRLDSTNIITPLLSVITNIGMDHISILGNTLGAIAKEKAGIIKPNIPLVIGRRQNELQPIFESIAENNQTTIHYSNEGFRVDMNEILNGFRSVNIWHDDELVLPDLKFPLLGCYQEENILTVLSSINLLVSQGFKISENQIKNGLEKVIQNTNLLGRWQILGQNPAIICDTGHNEDGVRRIVEQLSQEKYEKLHIVLGVAEDKDVKEILSLLPTHAIYYFTCAKSPRSLPPNKLKEMGRVLHLQGESYNSVHDAFISAKKNASANDLVFIGGSTFVVAEVI